MKKSLLGLVAVLLMSTSAFAQNRTLQDALWACTMGYDVESEGVQILFGNFSLEGKGQLDCVALDGQKVSYPLNVSISANKLSPTIGLGKFRVKGVSAAVSLFNEDPQDLLGKYIIVSGHASAFIGAGAMVAIHADLPNISLNVSVSLASGFGVQAGLSTMHIELAE